MTQSRLDRQNILNNDLAIQEIQETSVVETLFFEDWLLMIKEMVPSFFEVDIRMIECYISANSEELRQKWLRFAERKEIEGAFKVL